jgi:very-short-patch-repair endonuclease
VVHWSTTLGKSAIPWEVSPLDALLQAIKCLPPDDALASVESALHTGFITEDEFDELVLRAPERLHGVLGKVDRGAQSGFETHTRLRILRAGFRVKTQFYVPRAGHFDLLVNDCVAVETDGAKWHGPERFLPDRTKDLIAEGQGVRVLRIGRPHIFEWWPQTLHTIQQMVSDAEHGSQQR